MKGFFTIDKPVATPPRTSCGGTCALNKGCRSPKMPVTGEGRMKILVVAESPGKLEDEQNTQLIGPAGQVLRDTLAEFGVDLDRDCRKTNVCRCRPPDNRKPTTREIETCSPHIWDEIKEHPPKIILVLGQVALESLLMNRVTNIGQIGRWRGFAIPDQKVGAWVCPAFHPSYILRSMEGYAGRGATQAATTAEYRTFLNDIENALAKVNEPFPVAPVPVIRSPSDSDFLRWKKTPEMIAIDYETTGLKPYRKGHRIVSCGVCWGEEAVAFPMTSEIAREWKKVLSDPTIKKISHNCKFEHIWASHILGIETRGWVWDTMIAAHLADNRRGITSLKHQAFLTLGVPNWAGDVKDSLDSNEDEKHGANGFNGLVVSDQLLQYNALDAYFTLAIAKQQMKMFK